MLRELKFVQGAVAKKELIPTLTHVRIENGQVRSFNGTLALSSPISFDIDCTPKAIPFIKAIGLCKDTVTMSMTKTGRLRIKSGSYKVFIECVEEETPHVEPEGEMFEINGGELLNALKNIAPFMGDDASRPWSNGILLSQNSAFATNNICLVEYWIGTKFPIECNLPREAVKEMIRINEAPINAQSTDNNITFHYEDGRWLRTSLYDASWPDVRKIINVESNLQPINNLIFEGLEFLKPFVDKLERVYFKNGEMRTSLSNEDGATYTLEEFDHEGVYQHNMLSLLQKIVTHIDFSLHPKPCVFQGEKLRGVIVGMVN